MGIRRAKMNTDRDHMRGRPAKLAAAALAAAKGLAQRTLPPNRFQRALRFAVSGLGIGLLLTLAFSVVRVFPLPPVAWLPFLVIPTVIGFATGYMAQGAVDASTKKNSRTSANETLDAIAATVGATGEGTESNNNR
jgi:hypothetical protein